MVDRGVALNPIRVHGEVAGQPLPEGPVLWNADAVVVTLRTSLPVHARNPEDFVAYMPGVQRLVADGFKAVPGQPDCFFLAFRLPVPQAAVPVDVVWKNKLLANARVEVIAETDYFQGLQAELITVGPVYPAGHTQATQLSTRGLQGVFSSVSLSHSQTLAGLAGVGLKLGVSTPVSVPVSVGQLVSTRAVVHGLLPIRRMAAGRHTLTWYAGMRELVRVPLQSVTPGRFSKMIKVQSTRHLWHDARGHFHATTAPPPEDATRVGARFVVRTGTVNASGPMEFDLRCGVTSWPLNTVLVSDGGTILDSPMVPPKDLPAGEPWTLTWGGSTPAVLPRGAVSAPVFNAEGSIQRQLEFSWTPATEAELLKRLNELQ